ncbi:hypothetical protein Val02_82670 [Virgisporangium aliadipatigenens]|uniref:Uncharacterized protein n=1 Tax=Virgisporangium aliadipatigenens TaxID=741659 RepID=A0A8J3YX65_9ACTN|nr:hypothetical protein [Virgisporangium aliadipatigenens]GIJ51381.1 hypothetical protein Val02_82670 [Virgisporangium aliadipatigenens]
MNGSWARIDWDAARPDEQAVRRARARLRYQAKALPAAGVDELVLALRRTHVNGGALVAGFRVVDDDVTGWFAARNRFSEFGFFSHFLGSAAVREALPELQIPESLEDDLRFEESWSGTLSLGGELAAMLVHGGAYEAFPGSPMEAKRLGDAFVEAIVGERHDRFHVYRSHRRWCSWFFDIAWDSTSILIDREHAEIVLLCITDTD